MVSYNNNNDTIIHYFLLYNWGIPAAPWFPWRPSLQRLPSCEHNSQGENWPKNFRTRSRKVTEEHFYRKNTCYQLYSHYDTYIYTYIYKNIHIVWHVYIILYIYIYILIWIYNFGSKSEKRLGKKPGFQPYYPTRTPIQRVWEHHCGLSTQTQW